MNFKLLFFNKMELPAFYTSLLFHWQPVSTKPEKRFPQTPSAPFSKFLNSLLPISSTFCQQPLAFYNQFSHQFSINSSPYFAKFLHLRAVVLVIVFLSLSVFVTLKCTWKCIDIERFHLTLSVSFVLHHRSAT